MGFENNFNGTTFHHHFCLKTGVSRNGLSLGYSERDTSTVYSLALASSIPSWLDWAGIDCMVQVDLLKQPINQFKPVSKADKRS